jgi:hypothetical protein
VSTTTTQDPVARRRRSTHLTRLRVDLHLRGILVNDFAEAIGYAPKTLTELFAGRTHASALMRYLVSEKLGVDEATYFDADGALLPIER